MARYRLSIKRTATKELGAVEPKANRQRFVARIESLADDPRPPGSEKLAGQADRYRLRQGDYRVVYSVDEADRIVLIVKIGHRREVYR